MTSTEHAATREQTGEAGNEAADAARSERITAMFRRGLAGQRRALDPARHLVGHPSVGGAMAYRAAQSLWLAYALLRQAAAGRAARTALR
jgi:hypothetical protein